MHLTRSSSTSGIRGDEILITSLEIPKGPEKPSIELATLLQNDPYLTQFNLIQLVSSPGTLLEGQQGKHLERDHSSSSSDDGVYAYASWLLMGGDSDSVANTIPDTKLHGTVTWSTTQATLALEQIEHKLQLIQQLSQRISREKPEDVAGPLLRLHGYSIDDSKSSSPSSLKETNKDSTNDGLKTKEITSSSLSLRTLRDRCDRLHKQSQVYEGMALRVELTLSRAWKTFSTSTLVLQRLIQISKVLKIVMKLRFEAWKVMDVSTSSSSLDLFLPMITSPILSHSTSLSSNASVVDLRELTRAAASVSVMKELLQAPELQEGSITIVEQLRPEVDRLIRIVRNAAAKLLEEYSQFSEKVDGGDMDYLLGGNSSRNASSVYVSAALQVYFSLGELPSAVWTTISSISDLVEKATGAILNPAAMQRLVEAVKTEAKAFAAKEESTSPSNIVSGLKNKTSSDPVYERIRIKVLKEKRAQAASKVAQATLDACVQVWNLQRVLMRKADPVNRQNFYTLVCQSPIPERFRPADSLKSDREKQKSIFTIFFNGVCISLGSRLQKLLKYDNGVISREVAALYPFIRSEYVGVVKAIHDIMQASSSIISFPSTDVASGYNIQGSSGILGGSSSLMEAGFFSFMDRNDNFLPSTQSDTWTTISRLNKSHNPSSKAHFSHPSSTLASLYGSTEWNSLQGSGSAIGLQPLQQAFISEVQKQLQQPLETMFPESVNVDDNGILTSVFPLLPSKYDLEKLEKQIIDVLGEGDLKMGEFSLVKILTECVVETVEKFCALAKNASSGAHEDYLMKDNFIATDNLVHDLKVIHLMDTLRSSLKAIPDKAFVAPYRPADSPQHHEAANVCEIALLPAIHEIDGVVKTQVLNPIIRVVNRRIAVTMGAVHRGIYLEALKDSADSSFVERSLVPLFSSLQSNILSKLPSDFASFISASTTVYSIYCFISNVALVRPIGESSRLRITQDLADLEMALEQFARKAGSNAAIPLQRINGGKPYAELRAVRQLLFWNGFDSKDSVEKLASNILHENWIKDIRPSTVIHFFSSFGPKLFSSPHHFHRLNAGDYVMNNLLAAEGSYEDGEVNAWLTILNCCDSYQQRESLDNTDTAGDKRVVGLLHIVGPELLKRIRP